MLDTGFFCVFFWYVNGVNGISFFYQSIPHWERLDLTQTTSKTSCSKKKNKSQNHIFPPWFSTNYWTLQKAIGSLDFNGNDLPGQASRGPQRWPGGKHCLRSLDPMVSVSRISASTVWILSIYVYMYVYIYIYMIWIIIQYLWIWYVYVYIYIYDMDHYTVFMDMICICIYIYIYIYMIWIDMAGFAVI